MNTIELAGKVFGWLSARPVPIQKWHFGYRSLDELVELARQYSAPEKEVDLLAAEIDGVVRLVRSAERMLAEFKHLNAATEFFWDFRGQCASGFADNMVTQLQAYTRVTMVYSVLWWTICTEIGRGDLAGKLFPVLDMSIELGSNGGWMLSGPPAKWLELFVDDATNERVLAPLTAYRRELA